jgi:hypothetical protein
MPSKLGQRTQINGRVMNGATDGATLEAWRNKTRMDAGSAADWEVMIDHM